VHYSVAVGIAAACGAHGPRFIEHDEDEARTSKRTCRRCLAILMARYVVYGSVPGAGIIRSVRTCMGRLGIPFSYTRGQHLVFRVSAAHARCLPRWSRAYIKKRRIDVSEAPCPYLPTDPADPKCGYYAFRLNCSADDWLRTRLRWRTVRSRGRMAT
jgi:hypothetical protein